MLNSFHAYLISYPFLFRLVRVVYYLSIYLSIYLDEYVHARWLSFIHSFSYFFLPLTRRVAKSFGTVTKLRRGENKRLRKKKAPPAWLPVILHALKDQNRKYAGIMCPIIVIGIKFLKMILSSCNVLHFLVT